jgi:CRP-like cAMP-binding protein
MAINTMPVPSEPRGADKRTMLRSHGLFGKLTPQHIDRLSSCIVTKTAKRGTNIFAKGGLGSRLWAIREGTVKISAPLVDGKDAVFDMLGKGDIFGEIALLDGNPRTADATAVTDCELYVIERRDFLPLMREDPEIALRLIEILCSRLRRPPSRLKRLCLTSEIRLVCLRDVPDPASFPRVLGTDIFRDCTQGAPISHGCRPRHRENAFILDRKLKLEPLAAIIGVDSQPGVANTAKIFL